VVDSRSSLTDQERLARLEESEQKIDSDGFIEGDARKLDYRSVRFVNRGWKHHQREQMRMSRG